MLRTFSLPAALLRLPHPDFDGKLTVTFVRGRKNDRKVKEGDWIDADMLQVGFAHDELGRGVFF